MTALPAPIPAPTLTTLPLENPARITGAPENESEGHQGGKRWWWDDEESTTRKSAKQSEVIIVDGTKTKTLKVLAETSTSRRKKKTKTSKTSTLEYQILTVYNAPPKTSKSGRKNPPKTTSFQLVTVYNKATGLSQASGRGSEGDVLAPYQVYTIFDKPTDSRKGFKAKGEAKAGKLPIYQMLIVFVFVIGVGGGILWYFRNQKMLKLQQKRKKTSKAKKEQLEWEKEMREIPDPELEKEADHMVENLPYAPEGLFYETANPLDLDNQGDIADERWDDGRQEHDHRHRDHTHHHGHYRPSDLGRHHGHHQPSERERRPSSGTGQSFYEQSSYRAVLPPY